MLMTLNEVGEVEPREEMGSRARRDKPDDRRNEVALVTHSPSPAPDSHRIRFNISLTASARASELLLEPPMHLSPRPRSWSAALVAE